MISVDSILSDEQDLNKLNDLCRLCGNLKDSSALIFDDVHEQHYDDVINIYFRDEFRICRDDALPQKICRNCLTSVESWNQFYINCVHVNEKFHQIVEKFNLSKDLTKKSNDMNTDIEVIEVGVEGDNYDFFNDQVTTNEIDISNIKFTHSFPDSGNLQNFDNAVEDITYTNDTTEPNTSNQPSTDQPECNNGSENTTSIVIGDDYDDSNVEDDDDVDETGIVDSDCTENSTLPAAPAIAPSLDELQAASTSLPFDDDPDSTELDTGMLPLRCAVCSKTSFSGQLIDNQYVCEACCNVKLESNDDELYLDEGAGGDSADDSVASHSLSDKLRCASMSDDDIDLTAMKTLPDEKYQCALCNKVYCKKKSMINHMKNHNKKVFTCKVCNSNFRTQMQLKKHKKRHVRKLTNNTLIYCEICKKYFKTKKGFAYHQQKICIQYKCYICDEKFLVHSVLLDHMRTVHDDVKKSTATLASSIPLGTNESASTTATTPANDNETIMSVCPICNKVVTQAVLPRHMILHSEDKPFTCDMCGKSFKRKHSLQDHIMIEMGMKNYVCDICGMKFLKQGYLNKHVRYHQLNNGEYQGFRCEMCGKKFPEKWRLGVHQRSVHKGGRFSSCKCDICGNMFAERWMVRRHKAQEHNGEEFKEYQCDVCGKKFQEKWMIRSHQRSTHKSGVKKMYCELCGRSDHQQKDCTHRHAVQEVTCELCGEQFSSNFTLKEHIASHVATTQSYDQIGQLIKVEDPTPTAMQDTKKSVLHICSGCGKQFVNKQQLRRHEIAANCANDIKYECEECGKIFHSKSSLSNHLMSHRKAGIPTMFKCGFCNREFRNSDALDSHMSADKLCLICGKVYPCDDQLRNHVYKEHDDDDEDENRLPAAKRSRIQNDESSQDEADGKSTGAQAAKPFECRLCHKKFARKQAMKNHLYAELNLRRHECEFCDKRYNYYSHLKEHIITNHGEKEYACVYCGKDFPTRKRFRDHVTLHLDDKPFLCECGLSFKLNRYLSKHKKKCKAVMKKEI